MGASVDVHSERRAWPRKDCLLPASIHSPGYKSHFDGYITEISVSGLRLRSKSGVNGKMPVVVDFSIQGLELSVSGRIRWQNGKIMGVEYRQPVTKETEKNIFAFVNSP